MQVEAAQVGLYLAKVWIRPRRGDRRLEPFRKARDGALAAGGPDFGGAEGVGFAGREGGGGRGGPEEFGEGGDGGVFEICRPGAFCGGGLW